MQFLYPGFLWALTALAIPIILHLFYFRRYKKIYFSNLRFLREVKEETSARNRLRNLLILLARLLAMALIILAFAQPILPVKDAVKAGQRNVSVFVDNSFSMQSFGEDLSLFDRSRQKAQEIIRGYGPDDRFQILGHELSASQQLWISRDDALERLEEMDFTPAVKPLSVVYGRQRQSFAREEGIPEAWMVSDFQSTITDLDPADTSFNLNLVPLKGVREKNVSIDTAWFESPVISLNQTATLLFKLHNYASQSTENVRVTLELDGQERPEGTVDIEGGAILTDTARITVLNTGWHKVAIRISDFPVTFDDTYYLSFYVRENLNVLAINDKNQNPRIGAVFANAANYRFEQTSILQLEFSRLSDYQLIILNEPEAVSSGLATALRQYIEEGGNVLFVPSKNGSPERYNPFLNELQAGSLQPYREDERQVGSVNTDAFIYKDVFRQVRSNMRLPKVTGSFPSVGSGSRGQSLLTFRDGGDLATFFPRGNGALCVLYAPLDESVNDLITQPEIFVPLLYKMAIYTSDAKDVALTIGIDQLIPIDRKQIRLADAVEVSGPATFIPGVSPLGSKIMIDVQGQLQESGFYELKQAGQLIAVFAFNYDRAESDLAVTPAEELPKLDHVVMWNDTENADITQLIETRRQGRPLWKWCIIAALIFIGVEIALIRLWKSG